jgi:SAM-dependent methyltransferase
MSDIDLVLQSWGDDQEGPANGEQGRLLLEKVALTLAKRVAGGRVCDLGCGNGFLADILANRGYDVVGVDASESLLSIARRRKGSQKIVYRRLVFGDNIDGVGGLGGFDAVVSVDVIEHLFKPASLIDTAFALLKPGGTLVVCTPYHGYLKNLAISALGKWDAHHHVHFDGGHIKFFSVKTLRNVVQRRFIVDGFEFDGRAPGFWKNMICIARKPEP